MIFSVYYFILGIIALLGIVDILLTLAKRSYLPAKCFHREEKVYVLPFVYFEFRKTSHCFFCHRKSNGWIDKIFKNEFCPLAYRQRSLYDCFGGERFFGIQLSARLSHYLCLYTPKLGLFPAPVATSVPFTVGNSRNLRQTGLGDV